MKVGRYIIYVLFVDAFLFIEGNVQKTTDGTVRRFLISFQVAQRRKGSEQHLHGELEKYRVGKKKTPLGQAQTCDEP